MAKKLEDMTRGELLEIYEEQGGSLDDFDKRYVNRQDLLDALLEEEQQSAAFASDFEFIEEDDDDSSVPAPAPEPSDEEPAHSDQWYKMRGLDVPQN